MIESLGRELHIANHVLAFPFAIDRAEEVGELIIVVLDGTDTPDRWNNVFAYNRDGEMAWQIQDPMNISKHSNHVPYVGFRATSDTELLVTNFNGVTYRVDIRTGHILGMGSPTK